GCVITGASRHLSRCFVAMLWQRKRLVIWDLRRLRGHRDIATLRQPFCRDAPPQGTTRANPGPPGPRPQDRPPMSILDRIVAAKWREVEAGRARVPEAELERRLAEAPPVRDFRAALEQPGGIQVIAEVKKASPSAGVLRADFNPVAIARTYAAHGAAAISVPTDAPFFQGQPAYLTAIRAAVPTPLLRKDFLL